MATHVKKYGITRALSHYQRSHLQGDGLTKRRLVGRAQRRLRWAAGDLQAGSIGVTIHSVFDSEDRRIVEGHEVTGALIREYVWLGWGPTGC